MIERLRFLFGFSKYLLPIILSALPIILLRLNVPEEKKRESEELKREWLSKSSKYVFRFREESKISFWLEETARRLKHNVLSSKIPFDGLSNFTHSLVSAIPGSYPKGVPKCKIWGVFISKKNSQPDAEICQDKLLEKECKKLVVSMMSGLSLDYSSNEDSDREFSKSNLVKRFKAAFGEGITSRVFDQDNRGIAYSVIFQGKPYLQLWDLIFQKQKIVGGFILMMPVGLNSSQNGPKICLLNWAKGPFFPAFIPFPVPGYDISSFPIGLHPKIRNSKILSGLRSYQNGITVKPETSGYKLGPNVRILSPLLGKVLQFPDVDDYWVRSLPLDPLSNSVGVILSKKPRPPPLLIERIAWLLEVFFCFSWSLVLIRILLLKRQINLGIRLELMLWFLGLVSVPAVLGLVAVAKLEGDLRSNEHEAIHRDLTHALYEIETGVNRLDNHCIQTFRALISEPWLKPQLKEIQLTLAPSGEFIEKVWKYFSERDIKLSGLLILGRNRFSLEKYLSDFSRVARNLLRMVLFKVWDESAKNMETPEEFKKSKSSPNGKKAKGPLLEMFSEGNYKQKDTMERSDVWKAGKKQFKTFRNALYSGNYLEYQINAVWNQEPQYQTYFEGLMRNPPEWWKEKKIGTTIFKIRPSGLKKVVSLIDRSFSPLPFPELRRIAWNSRHYAFPVFEKGGRLILAYPSRLLPGYILVGYASLDPLRSFIFWKRSAFFALLVLMMGIVFFASLILSEWLAFPLRRMTAGLLQVANGNFNVKVAENRKDELGQAGKILDTMTSWLLERKKMSRFVAPQVLDIVSSGDFKGATEGVKKDVVVLVSDIRNFTTLSENFPPREIFSALNKHLDAMTRVIQKQHGVIDRFIGDAIIAVFYPSEKDSPAFRAIQAAASMRKEHNEIISVRRRRGEFVYEIGVGIESGQVVAGVMGDSKARLDFTVLGEPLQKAAELESASKKTSGTKIIVSSKVRAETNRDFHFVAVPGVDGAWELESVQIDNLLKTHPLQVGREVEIGDSAIEGSPALIPTLGFAPEKGPLFSTMSLSYCFLGIMPFVMVFIALNFWQSCVERSAKKEAQNSAQKSLRHIEQTIDAKLQIGLLVRNVLSAIRRLVENPAKNDSALKRLVNSRLDVVRKILPNSYWYYLSPERSRTRVKQKKLKTEFVHVPTNSISNFLTASEVENFLNHFLITLNSAEIFLYDDPDLSNMGSSFQSFFKAFKNRFGEFGIHNFTKLILQSYGDLIPVAVNKLPKLLFWELLYPSASSSIEIKRKEGDELGGFFLLVDSMDLGISTGIRCLVENFQIGGTQIAFFPETGSQPWGYVSPMFKRSRVLKKILSKPFAETQFYEGWVACEKVIYADQKYRVLIAFPFQGSSAVISKLKSVFLLIVFLGLLFGGFLFLSDYKATFGKVSLGTQLACAFLSVLFPSLIVGIFTLEGSFSERVTRKYLDNQRNLNETLANVDESSQMYSGFISSLVKQVTSEQSFLKKVENAEKKFLENPRVFKDQNVMLELYQKWHALGFDLSHCKIVGGNGFSLETGIHKEKADLFRIVSERALLALNPGLEAQKATNLRRSNILKGAEVDEILSFSETLLPVDTFSAWLVAPRSYGYLVAPGSPEVHCLNQYLLKDGKPRWFLQVDWAQNSLRVHTLREWSNFFSDSKNIVFGASSYDFPSWSLIPPFYSYDFQDPESENYEEGNLIMEEKVGYQYPEIGIQIKMAQGSKEAFSGIVGKGDNSQLLYVFPGREMKKIALYCLSSISGSLESTFQSAGKQRSVFFILVSISIFLAFKVSHRFLNPVLDLISGARKIMQGNFSPRLFDEGEDEFSRLGKSFNKMAKGVAEGELLSRFVSDSVQATVRSSEKEFAAKEGEGMTVAVLFSDISRFKEMMRETAAVKIVESLNQYLEKMSFLIRSHGGDIDKFMGNKILAVFYPRKLGSIEEAVSSAMRSARAMQSAMDDLDAWKEKSIGIGIAVGPVLAGILGSPEVRLEYTVIGDTVNLASRLCEMASQKPNGGLVIEMNSVQRLMKIGNHQLIRGLQRLGDVSVKGKMRKVSAFILERKDT